MTIYSLYENNENRVIRYTLIFLMNCIAMPLILMWTIGGMLLFPVGFLFMKVALGYSIRFIMRKCIWIYGRAWQFLLSLFVVFVPPKTFGQPFKKPGVIVVNHRSFFDTYCMNMLPISDVCFAVRAWPFKIPLFSIFMKLAGYINIESFSWDKMMVIAKNNFKNKSYILFFPEGHRSLDRNMTKFHSGAFKLAIENNVPVIPICITGTQALLAPKRHYLKPAKIKMRVLAPVFPDQFDGDMKHLAFKRNVKAKMEECINQMEKGCI
ncbi:MAG: 1-acyl-sn-glycerol-3-phosphate acyltransferase [Desulfobacula sp.]|nr:1-acyl-sn-glycerol-3-phosphate acyltransferase [Desulfobacula sp.]